MSNRWSFSVNAFQWFYYTLWLAVRLWKDSRNQCFLKTDKSMLLILDSVLLHMGSSRAWLSSLIAKNIYPSNESVDFSINTRSVNRIYHQIYLESTYLYDYMWFRSSAHNHTDPIDAYLPYGKFKMWYRYWKINFFHTCEW